MGTGKSAVGRRLATITGRDFVDTDAEIIANHGAIANIFERDGEERFRDLERQVISELAPRRNLVIATGGGTLVDADNVLALMGNEIFTLTASPEEILRRITKDGINTRPLVATAEDPAAVIGAQLAERVEAYGKFATVDTTGKTLDEVVDALRDAGATIGTEDEVIAQAASVRSSGDVAITVIIAAAVAVLVVLIVLVMTF